MHNLDSVLLLLVMLVAHRRPRIKTKLRKSGAPVAHDVDDHPKNEARGLLRPGLDEEHDEDQSPDSVGDHVQKAAELGTLVQSSSCEPV